MHDPLRTDIHPAAGGHLSVISDTHLGGYMPVFLIVEQADHHGIGNNHTGCIRLGTEQSQRMSGLDHECLLIRQYFEILLDQAILHPVLANLPGFAIRDQFVWIESDIETEIVVDHHLESLSLQTLPFILVDRLGFQVSFRPITVSVNAAASHQLFHKLRSQHFMQLFGNVTERILQGRFCLCRRK